MADSVQPVFGHPGLRISHTCAAAVLAGKVVELTAARTVQHAAAGSLKVVGVAMHDVPATRATVGGPQVGDGNELTVISGVVIAVEFAAAAAIGDKLIAAAAGTVTPVTIATQDVRTVVGYAFEVVAGAGRGLAYIAPGGSL